MDLVKQNDEVYYPGRGSLRLTPEVTAFLKQQASKNPRRRCRLCFHASPDSPLHEMVIVHSRGNYIPPHLHTGSDESVTVLEGEAAIILFAPDGEVKETVYLNANPNLGANYIRLPKGQIHSLFVESELFVFKETILGPFDRNTNVEPEWGESETSTNLAWVMREYQSYFNKAKANAH